MTSHSQIDVAFCTDEDIPTCFDVLSKSFAHDAPFVDSYFPNHDTPLGRKQGSERLLAWKQHEPNCIFLKAVITQDDHQQQERIAGIAVWTHMTEPPPVDLAEAEDVEKVWPDLADREFMMGLWKDYVVPRTKAIEKAGSRGVYVLELLAIHPDFQRRGAGTALVQWGTNKADELGLVAVVEATPVGRRTYESCGFVTEIERMTFNIDAEFNHRKAPVLVFLSRNATR